MTAGMAGKGGTGVACRVLFAVCVAMVIVPSSATAQWEEFLPRPLENGAFFDSFTSHERDSRHTGNQSIRWRDTFFRERLTLYSDGYSYHPRFLLYHFSISGSAREEDYETSSRADGGWQYGSGYEFDARLHFLPEHPYNLTVFASRHEPIFRELSVTQLDSIQNSRGALFRYRQRPYFLRTGFINDSYETGASSSDVSRFSLNGEYVKDFGDSDQLTFNAGFNPSWFSNSAGLDGNTTEYVAGNLVRWWRLRLYSSVSKETFDQTDPSSLKFSSDHLAWYEQLSAYLPWNFRSDLYYRYRDNDSTTENASGAPARHLSDRGRDLQFDIVHRLYQSLDTNYTFLDSSRTSFGGETTNRGHSLAIDYAKSIPRGRLLAGISVGRSDTNSQGQAEVVDELHSAVPVPGTFVLQQPNVASVIAVYLKSPLPPYEAILLVEGPAGNYTVGPGAAPNTVEITVTSLPPDFVVQATYDFFVSYSLVSGNFELRTDTFGGNAGAVLFENLLQPYFSYLAVRSQVLSGTFAAPSVDSDSYTTGLIVNYRSLRLRGEYQELDWQIGPYRAWRAEAQYVATLNPTTNVYGTLAYLNRDYFRGQSAYRSAPYTEESETAGASIQKHFFSRRMLAAVGGSYTHLQGLVDTEAYAVNGSFSWRIGKVDLVAGANAFASDSSGTGVFADRRDHERFYLSIRRKLF